MGRYASEPVHGPLPPMDPQERAREAALHSPPCTCPPTTKAQEDD